MSQEHSPATHSEDDWLDMAVNHLEDNGMPICAKAVRDLWARSTPSERGEPVFENLQDAPRVLRNTFTIQHDGKRADVVFASFAACIERENNSLRSVPSATPRSLDEERWKFCMKHGFPKACFNPEREVSYFYIRADVCDDTSFGWDTPEKAVDATMKAIKERDEAAARWQQETRT